MVRPVLPTNSLKALLSISALLFVAGAAAASPVNVGNYATIDAQAAAQAHTDAITNDAQLLVGEAKAQADAVASHAKGEASADASASTGAFAAIKAGAESNFGALKGWFMGLFGQAKGAANVDAKGAIGQAEDAKDGKLDATTGIDAASHVDAKSLAPPQPDTSFLGGVKASLSAMLHLG